MRQVIFPVIAVLLMLPGLVQADSAYGDLQAVHEKNIITKNLYKICTPQGSPSSEVWEKTIMVDTCSQQHIREATLTIQRNNQNNCWEAFDKVECPDLQTFG